jgi:peptide/nickel transport system substrate-binding protein
VAASPTVVDVGSPVSFAVTATDPEGDAVAFAWDFGDGTNGTGANPTHRFEAPGQYVVAVAARDEAGNVASGDARLLHVVVERRFVPAPTDAGDAPVPVAFVAASTAVATVADTVTFDARSSWAWVGDGGAWRIAAYDDTAASLTFTWDFGDGTQFQGGPASAAVVDHVFPAPGSYPVRLVVSHGHGTDVAVYTVRVVTTVPTGTVKQPLTFFAALEEPRTLDPAVADDAASFGVIEQVAEPLFRFDRARRLVPVLAQTVPSVENGLVSPDGRNVTVPLKAGVPFHDGTLLDADDVVFSLRRVLFLNGPRAWVLDQALTCLARDDGATAEDERLAAINRSVERLDNATVLFRLCFPYAGFLAALASPTASVVPEGSVPPDAAVPGRLTGTGPYRLVDWRPHVRIALAAFDGYHGPPAAVEAVHLLLGVRNPGSRVTLLRAGDVDVAALPAAAALALPTEGIAVARGPVAEAVLLGFNQRINLTGVPPEETDVPSTFFAEGRVRKAFAAAFDYGAYRRARPEDVPLAGPLPATIPGWNASLEPQERNATASVRFLQNASDPRTADGNDTYWTNGFNLTLYYPEGDGTWRTAMTAFASGFSLLNDARPGLPPLRVGIQPLAPADYAAALAAGRLPVVPVRWRAAYYDADAFAWPLLAQDGAVARLLAYGNATLAALLEEARMETNGDRRLGLYGRLDALAAQDAGYVWLAQPVPFLALRAWVQGFVFDPLDHAPPFAALTKG